MRLVRRFRRNSRSPMGSRPKLIHEFFEAMFDSKFPFNQNENQLLNVPMFALKGSADFESIFQHFPDEGFT